MRVLRAADRIAVPWKNGGGVTREVAAWPPGAGFDDFLWRVSMAAVTADGPFSVFEGVDRILLVLEGRLRLQIESRPPVELGPGDLASFPGDAPTHGVVLSGPVFDLNLMTRRGQVEARLERLTQPAPGPGLAIVTGAARLATGESLARYDALLLEAGETVPIEPLDDGVVWLARFD